MYEIEEKSFHFATYLPSLLYDVLSGLICASKYERDRDKWSRPTLISLPERQGIGKLSTLRLRGRNPGKRSGNTPRSRITRFTLFLFCFVFSGNASAYILFAVTGRTQASVNNNSDLQIEVRGRFLARVLRSDQVHFHNFRPPNLKRVLSSEKNSYS